MQARRRAKHSAGLQVPFWARRLQLQRLGLLQTCVSQAAPHIWRGPLPAQPAQVPVRARSAQTWEVAPDRCNSMLCTPSVRSPANHKWACRAPRLKCVCKPRCQKGLAAPAAGQAVPAVHGRHACTPPAGWHARCLVQQRSDRMRHGCVRAACSQQPCQSMPGALAPAHVQAADSGRDGTLGGRGALSAGQRTGLQGWPAHLLAQQHSACGAGPDACSVEAGVLPGAAGRAGTRQQSPAPAAGGWLGAHCLQPKAKACRVASSLAWAASSTSTVWNAPPSCTGPGLSAPSQSRASGWDPGPRARVSG